MGSTTGSAIPLKGFMWLFMIIGDITSYASYVSAISSPNCLAGSGSCPSCNPVVVGLYWELPALRSKALNITMPLEYRVRYRDVASMALRR